MASSYAKWRKTGEITKSDFAKKIGIGTQGALNNIGAFALKNMQDITRKHDASGELTDSLMWINAGNKSNMGSRANESKPLDKPSNPYAVLIGSAAEHAIYRETESGIHLNDDGSELFVERMKDWYRLRFHAEPDLPENKYSFYKLLEKIRNTKTTGVPFVKPTKDMIVPYALKQFKLAINTALKAKK